MGLGARLAALFAAVAAGTALLVGGATYVTTERQVGNEIDQFLRQRATEIADGQRDQPRDRRDGQSNGQVVVAVSPDAEVQILDRDGSVDSNTGQLLPVDDTDLDVAARSRGTALRTISIDGTEYRMITKHLSAGGAVQVARSLEESASLLDVVRTRILTVAGVVAILAGAVGWAVAQRTTRPLRALSLAVDDVAETRDFSVLVPASGRDEVGRLAYGFNRMLDALQRSQEQQHRLVHDAAHELRTPLTSVTANIEWLLRATDLDPAVRTETLAGVRRELGELNGLMDEIIELATDSREPPELVPTDLTTLVQEVVGDFVRRSGREVSVDASEATVMADPDSMRRAVTNLLSNADKYSPTDAPIAVGVGPAGVFVEDAGPGIPEPDRELVFGRFYRREPDRSKPGSGLGLSIVAGIVEQHRGTVGVTDSALGGARIGFSLPPAEPAGP